MSRKFETLVETFKSVEGVQRVKPAGAQQELLILRGSLLFPFRYAKDRSVNIMHARISERKPSALVKALFDRFAPEPVMWQLPLLGDKEQVESKSLARSLDRIPADTKLVLIGYACNADAGLLDVWWGRAELLDDQGSLRWHDCDPVPLPSAGQGRVRFSVVGPDSSAPPASPKFDQGDMPTPPLTPRPPVERENDVPPNAEEPPEDQDRADDEGE
jgi:hypothetical protein